MNRSCAHFDGALPVVVESGITLCNLKKSKRQSMKMTRLGYLGRHTVKE